MNGSNAIWQKNPEVAWKESDGEIVIVAPGQDLMHELNETASFLWKNIDGRKNAAELAALMAKRYEVTAETALRDTEELLQELRVKKLLVQPDSDRKGKELPLY